MSLAKEVTNWNTKKPAFYYGHMAFIDFSSFGVIAKPIYINIVRDPLERLISTYYYGHNGDNQPYMVERLKARNETTLTLDECMRNNGEGCQPKDLWLQIPYFCGQAAECWEVGSELALEMAKYNLVNNYLVVGLTEEHADFVAVLEAVLPRFFAGATQLYTHGNVSHVRKTLQKVLPSAEFRSILKKSNIWRMENEFYEFAKRQFHFVKQKVLNRSKL